MISSVFYDENDDLILRIRFEGFSRGLDETCRADALNRFRPHLGLESSVQTRRHRMYASTALHPPPSISSFHAPFLGYYRFGYSREQHYAEFEDVTDNPEFQVTEWKNILDDFE